MQAKNHEKNNSENLKIMF